MVLPPTPPTHTTDALINTDTQTMQFLRLCQAMGGGNYYVFIMSRWVNFFASHKYLTDFNEIWGR